ELSEGRVEVAAHRLNAEVRPQLPQLRGSAQRAGADLGAMREVGQALADDSVTMILTLRDGGEDEAGWEFGRKILQAVNGEIGASVEQRFFDFLGEEPFRA